MTASNESIAIVKSTPADQKASCNDVPKTVESHKNPNVTPLGGMCGPTGNTK